MTSDAARKAIRRFIGILPLFLTFIYALQGKEFREITESGYTCGIQAHKKRDSHKELAIRERK
jgi:hypothetical protein